jgi:hypothetical protein
MKSRAVLALLALALSTVATASSAAQKPLGAIYPSGPTVPENLLRIEVRLSAPLAALSMEHVRLYNSNGHEIKQVFLDLPLPDADGKRITILLHPGRVKTGVGANLALGRALHSGDTVTLVIDDPALAKPIRKTWRVTAFNSQLPQPARWTFEVPAVGSRGAIVLHLNEPISSAAESLIAVRAPDGTRLDGATQLEDGETAWRFVPAQPWQKATYAIVTHPDLEDPEGNRPCGPFEAVAASRVSCNDEVAREFSPRVRLATP